MVILQAWRSPEGGCSGLFSPGLDVADLAWGESNMFSLSGPWNYHHIPLRWQSVGTNALAGKEIPHFMACSATESLCDLGQVLISLSAQSLCEILFETPVLPVSCGRRQIIAATQRERQFIPLTGLLPSILFPNRMVLVLIALVCSGCYNRMPQTGWLMNKKSLLPAREAGKAKIKEGASRLGVW